MFIDYNKLEKFLDWLKKQILLDGLANKAANRTLKRGQVYRCNLGIGVGNEMQKERPCIIIQNDIGNKNSPNTIVIPITHNNTNLPFIISLQPQYESDGTTIKLDGQANISHIRSISKARLGNYITNLPQSEMKKIDAAIASNIDLMKYYSKIQKQYQDKLQYINKIKQDRNIAQDTLKEIRKILNISDESDIIQEVQKLKQKNG